MDVHGGGLNWRGATSAPFPGYLLIGRGPDFSNSLTSSGSDIIDQYAETLCGGSSTRYLYKGRCLEMGRFDAGTLGTDDGPRRITFRTTVHGPVVAYARVNGRRVAISSKRSSRGRETLFQITFQQLSDGTVDSAQSFFRAMAASPLTFNGFYVDHRDIAMYSAGRLPDRPAGVNRSFPTRGTGNYEWQGFISPAAHAQGVNPADGDLINWNNKPARGWGASDDQYEYGSVHRNELLERYVKARPRHTLATLTAAMNAPATQDVRIMEPWPSISRILATGPAPSARAAQLKAILDRWRRRGGSRLDRALDGDVDDPGAAIMDEAWIPMANAVMEPVLGEPLADELAGITGRQSVPPGGQVAGWYSYVDKDLRRLAGSRVTDPFRTRFCGRGALAACRTALWAALDGAGTALVAEQGPNPEAWRADATDEDITFGPIPLTTIRYTNRPSGIQQVVTYTSHRARASGGGGGGGFTGSAP